MLNVNQRADCSPTGARPALQFGTLAALVLAAALV